MNPLVSVIIPVYRVEEYLDACMESVLRQTYENLQIILVDDGSPDRCGQMCDDYAARDSRITVIHQQNGGLSAARNAGKAAATGDYITFLDSDDLLAPTAVQTMVELALSQQAQIVKIGIVRKHSLKDCVPQEGSYVTVTGVQAIGRIYRDGPQMVSCCGKLYEAQLLRDFAFPAGLYHEDEYSSPRLYYKARKVVLCASLLYFYMQWENESIIRGALNEKRIHDSVFVTCDRIEFFRQKGLKHLQMQAVQDHYHKLHHLEEQTRQDPTLQQQHALLKAQKKAFAKAHPCAIAAIRLRQMLARVKRRLCHGRER